MQGGYLMIDLADARLFERLRIGMQVGKPILIQDGSQNFFIDRITGGNPVYDEDDILTGYTDIVLLSANGSITITDANVVTKTNLDNVIYPLMENIKDASGNLRFVEGDGAPATIEGITSKYCKWSLSGTHLMLVYAFEIADTTALTNSQTLVRFEVPEFILNKIVPTITSSIISRTSINVVATDLSNQGISVAVSKTTSSIAVSVLGSFTATATRNGRFQFDLLIDNEDGE